MKGGFAASIPLGRLVRVEELTAVAVFLASNESSFVTGIDLCVAAVGARCKACLEPYSTVTDFARFRGWSTSHPRRTAM
jgi:hypothetical protein